MPTRGRSTAGSRGLRRTRRVRRAGKPAVREILAERASRPARLRYDGRSPMPGPRVAAVHTLMPRFAANLTMLYNELDFLDRFAAAARSGFKGVEYLFPYAYPKEVLAEQLARHRLTQ